MHWRSIEMAKDWRLRAQLTFLKKARRGAVEHPNGMSSIILEDIDAEEKQIRAEILRRKSVTSTPN